MINQGPNWPIAEVFSPFFINCLLRAQSFWWCSVVLSWVELESAQGNQKAPVMDIVYMTHILLIHFITTRIDIESLYHSIYFLTYPLQTVFYLLKTQKLLSYLLCSIYYLFCYIRVKGQHSRTCRVERSNLYSNTFLKWQVHLKCFRRLKTVLNHYINFSLSSTSCYIPINWNIFVMILTDDLLVYL